MNPTLIRIGGAVVAAATGGVGLYAAMIWWRRRHEGRLRLWSGEKIWPVLWVLAIVFISRLWAFSLGAIGAAHMDGAQTFAELWNRWDAPHYLDIARDGYQVTGDARYFIVFYPLYPWAVRAVSYITGNGFWAGMIVSNACLAAACVLLYRLFCMDMDGESAGWAIVFLCFSPLAFFMSIPYTESLFLLLSVCFFYAARRGRWLWAGVAGLLAALTRNFGILLLVPLVVFGIDKYRRKMRGGWWRWAICFLMILAGLFGYLLTNKVVTGDWWTFLSYQKEHWSNSFGFFGANVMRQFDWLASRSFRDIITVFGPNAAAFILSLGLIAYGVKRVPGAYLAYAIVYLAVAYSPTWLLSGGRYMTVVFPLWGILAATVTRKKTRFALLAVFEVLLGYYSFLFAMGWAVL
jgi:Gpi18-like mannosyltransferase